MNNFQSVKAFFRLFVKDVERVGVDAELVTFIDKKSEMAGHRHDELGAVRQFDDQALFFAEVLF
jgi:hypothetical protein